jgi:membrane peptidoglycan carboxypeptidase
VPTGIHLPDEKSGNVFGPSVRAARKSYWFIGDTLNLSIGQGETLVTPIQMAQVAAAVANGGTFWRPYYVERIITSAGEDVFKGKPEMLSQVVLKDSTWALIRDGLKHAVLDGTGQIAKIDGVDVFGKTGTAQNPHGKDHAWFVAFAQLPGEASEIAVAALVEYGEHGASSAAPIARDVIMASLRGKLTEGGEKPSRTPDRQAVMAPLPPPPGFGGAGRRASEGQAAPDGQAGGSQAVETVEEKSTTGDMQPATAVAPAAPTALSGLERQSDGDIRLSSPALSGSAESAVQASPPAGSVEIPAVPGEAGGLPASTATVREEGR